MVKSLMKAMKVLECFLTEGELGVTQIGERLLLNKSNVYDILSTFQNMGYIEQNQQNGKYRLGLKILEVSHAIVNQSGLRNSVYPHLKELANDTGETVYIGIPYGIYVLYLDAAYPDQVFVARSITGERAELYCTGIGKAILSGIPEAEWNSMIPSELKAYTDTTITDPAALFGDLRAARSRGFAIDNMEHEFGVKCVGVPVLSPEGRALAGVSVSGPSLRFADEVIHEYVPRLRRVANDIAYFFNEWR